MPFEPTPSEDFEFDVDTGLHVPEGMSEENLNHAENCVSWSDSLSEITVTTEMCTHVSPEIPDMTALVPGLTLNI